MNKYLLKISSVLPDQIYLKLMYRYYMHKNLNLKSPKSFNEKLQWLKLHDRKPIYNQMVDKVEAKNYVASKIGKQYIIPTLGIWDKPEDIDFDALPEQFVLKCNHNSGTGMCICRDKNSLDIEKVKEDLHRGLKQNYYQYYREWPYKNVTRKILAEKFLVDESETELKDYKVLCFGGEPKLIELHRGRFTNHQVQDFYDTNWNKTNITQGCVVSFQPSNVIMPKPETLDEMLKFSRILSKGISHVRVDWYSVNGQLYFGEITFYDGSGLEPFDNEEDDLLLGSWISLPISN